MITLLSIHIIIAVVTMAASAVGLGAAWRRSAATQSVLRVMWGSFVAVAGTGVALVATSPQALVHTCVMMTAYVAVTAVVQVYARRRMLATAEV